jgi:hypothetical protein
MKSVLTLAAAFAVAHSASAAFFAEEVISFTPGTGQTAYLDPAASLGAPPAFIADEFGTSNFSLYNSHYVATELTRVSLGGSLTLRLSHYVLIQPGAPEIGVWENVFFFENAGGTIAGAFGAGRARVQVSEDGVAWFSLNNDEPIVFGMGGTYFSNSGPYDSTPPSNPLLADFGKPFLGQPADFTGKTYGEAVTLLGGSAGGTWLDLDGVPLTQVGYVRFIGVEGGTLELNGVAINSAAAGAALPEPSVTMALAGAVALLGLIRRRSV